MIRILLPQDATALFQLIDSRQRGLLISNHPTIVTQQQFSVLNLLDESFKNLNGGMILGYYKDDELVGALFARVSSQQICYFLTRAYTSPTVDDSSILPNLISHCVKFYEQHGYNRFYAVYRTRHIDAYQRLWKTSESIPEYYTQTELEVGVNEKPRGQEFWEILYGRSLINEPTSIRMFVRLNNATVRSPNIV
jgi:hypothetical protein